MSHSTLSQPADSLASPNQWKTTDLTPVKKSARGSHHRPGTYLRGTEETGVKSPPLQASFDSFGNKSPVGGAESVPSSISEQATAGSPHRGGTAAIWGSRSTRIRHLGQHFRRTLGWSESAFWSPAGSLTSPLGIRPSFGTKTSQRHGLRPLGASSYVLSGRTSAG